MDDRSDTAAGRIDAQIASLASVDGHVRRAIDLREGHVIDLDAFRALIRAAAALNAAKPSRTGAGRRA